MKPIDACDVFENELRFMIEESTWKLHERYGLSAKIIDKTDGSLAKIEVNESFGKAFERHFAEQAVCLSVWEFPYSEEGVDRHVFCFSLECQRYVVDISLFRPETYYELGIELNSWEEDSTEWEGIQVEEMSSQLRQMLRQRIDWFVDILKECPSYRLYMATGECELEYEGDTANLYILS